MPARATRLPPTDPAMIETRLGARPLLGRNRWDLALVQCPNCGAQASVDRAGDLWCWSCNFTTSAQVACT